MTGILDRLFGTNDPQEVSIAYKPGAWSNISVKKGTRKRILKLKRIRPDGRKESIDDVIVKLLDAYEKVQP